MSNVVFGNTMDKFLKHRDVKPVITLAKRNYLVSKPNYLTTKLLSANVLVTETKRKKQILMNKLV